MTTEPQPAYLPVTTTASERIRARLVASNTRFHANDNIAAYIEPGELDQLLDEVSGHMQKVLESLVIDTVSDHNTQDTARRHLCPVIGKVGIGVMPNQHSNLIGLSKYARLASWIMSRPQIQEEAVVQLADLLQEKMQPDGLAVIMEADHFCMQWRGV